MIFTAAIRLPADNPSILFITRELAMVINNAQIIFVIKQEHICSYYISWFHWDVMVYGLLLGLCLLELQDMCYNFFMIFYVIININPI